MNTTMPSTDKFNKSQKLPILDLLKEIGNDGHSVYKTDILDEFPKALQERFIIEMKSNTKNPKETIFDHNGKIVKKVKAIYGLSVLKAICDDLNLEYKSCMGRGFQAQECTDAIRKFCA